MHFSSTLAMLLTPKPRFRKNPSTIEILSKLTCSAVCGVIIIDLHTLVLTIEMLFELYMRSDEILLLSLCAPGCYAYSATETNAVLPYVQRKISPRPQAFPVLAATMRLLAIERLDFPTSREC